MVIERVEELWKQFTENKDKEMRDALIVAYLPLVHKEVRKMVSHGNYVVNRDDLVGMGTLGLIDAIDRFDPQLGYEFVTFANWRIRGAILDGLRDLDWVPRSLRKKARDIEAAYASVEHRELRSAQDEEIAAVLRLSLQEFHQTLYEISLSPLVSLDGGVLQDDFEEAAALIDRIKDPSVREPDEVLARAQIQTIFGDVITRLPEKEKLVITLHYYEEFSFKEIADILDLSSSRISQLHTKAIYRLRGALSRRKKEIKD